MTKRTLVILVCLLAAPGTFAAESKVFPKGDNVVFRAGACKAELVQASSDGGKTWLNKSECATWGLFEDQIAQVHQAGECGVFLDYNVTMDDIPTLDCEKRPEKK